MYHGIPTRFYWLMLLILYRLEMNFSVVPLIFSCKFNSLRRLSGSLLIVEQGRNFYSNKNVNCTYFVRSNLLAAVDGIA